LGAAHDDAQLAAMAARLEAAAGRMDQRVPGQPPVDRRPAPGGDLGGERRRIDEGLRAGEGRQHERREGEGTQERLHAARPERMSAAVAPRRARTRWPSPRSTSPACSVPSRRKGIGQAAGTEARPSISAPRSRRRS
ncbi:MAG: hypothetical protein ACK559_39335, partial [bacterium]